MKPSCLGLTFILLAIIVMVIAVSSAPVHAAGLPSSVQFKVDQCNKSLDEAESELNARNPHMVREPLRVAKARLDSIKEYQSEHWNHTDVVAARNRYDALEKRYNEAAAKEASNEGLAQDQLKRLQAFRQFSTEGSYPEIMVANLPTYQAAKALIDEIAAAGTDVQLSGYSDYSMTKLNVQVYEQNRDRMVDQFISKAKEYSKKGTYRESDFLEKADQRLIDIAKLLGSDNPKVTEAQSAISTMKTVVRQDELEKAAKVFMSPEKYKGKDANSLRALAKKAVMEKFPTANILKIKLVSSKWGPPEGGAQWTDNTYSAVEVRTTSYFSVEIAAKRGQDVYLHRVYLYKEKVNGQLQPAKSYVVGTQMMLEKNVK